MHPWEEEPQEHWFKHAGFDCYLRQIPRLLHWCGYVKIPEAHFLYGENLQHSVLLTCHGGITCCGLMEGIGYFIGFDCAHADDYIPGLYQLSALEFYHYWTMEEVKKETENLAVQIDRLTKLNKDKEDIKQLIERTHHISELIKPDESLMKMMEEMQNLIHFKPREDKEDSE